MYTYGRNGNNFRSSDCAKKNPRSNLPTHAFRCNVGIYPGRQMQAARAHSAPGRAAQSESSLQRSPSNAPTASDAPLMEPTVAVVAITN